MRQTFIDHLWDAEIVPALSAYIRIPNKSPAFDPAWRTHGHMDRAVALFEGWAKAKLAAFPGAGLEVLRLPGRTPLICIEVPGATGRPERSEERVGATQNQSRATGRPERNEERVGATQNQSRATGRPERSEERVGAAQNQSRATGRPERREERVGATQNKSASGTVLMYGHLDKQPEMQGWTLCEGKAGGPWEPVLKDGRLYGRGGADDGYAMFAALAALLALKQDGQAHARAIILIEASEESGSPDLPAYVDHLAARIGTPDLVVCLDSGCGNYQQLWLTTSLRGMAMGTLTVRVLTEGVHSGAASGVVPSSFRILRTLLSRIEDEASGRLLLPELFVQIPPARQKEAAKAAAILGDTVWREMPFAGDTKSMAADNIDAVLQKTWMPQLAVTAMAGYPLPENGGNVLLPYSSAKLSFRLPPTAKAQAACAALKTALEKDPPYGAAVTFDAPGGEDGWNAPAPAPWLEAALETASQTAFGKPAAFMGEGGSIPFMAMLGRKFPQTQFVVTGVLGPHSNAHGPNEFLDIAYVKKLTAALASILADQARR